MDYSNQQNQAVGYNQASAAMQKQAFVAQETCVQPASEMNLVGNRIAGLLNGLAQHCERLQVAHDRLLGSQPSEKSAGQPPRPVPNGHIAQFNMGLDEINVRLDRADVILSRLIDAI